MRTRLLLVFALAGAGAFAVSCRNTSEDDPEVQGAPLAENAYLLHVSGMT